MAKNEYVFENTVREPSKGITAYGRTIGDGEIHLQYAPVAVCRFPGDITWTVGQCLLTENYLYFISATLIKNRQYLQIPIAKIERVKKNSLGYNLIVCLDALEYNFGLDQWKPVAQKWMDSIAKVKQEQSKSQPKDDSAAGTPFAPTKRFCSYCGAKLEGGNVYCPECGNAI